MRANRVVLGGACLLASSLVLCLGSTVAQQGPAERVGERVDEAGKAVRQGVGELSEALRKRFEVVRTDVQRMEAHPRVYSRIHWDKTLHNSKIDFHMYRDAT